MGISFIGGTPAPAPNDFPSYMSGGLPGPGAGGFGNLINVQVFTAVGAHTYTATVGTKSVVVETLGGGGAGGGSPSTGGAQVSAGGPGGGGGYAKGRFTSSFNGLTVTVGAAGTPVTGGTGGSGGNTTFGGLIHGDGGGGGGFGNVGSVSAGAPGAGGGAGGGNLCTTTGMIASGPSFASQSAGLVIAVGGANSQYGSGGGPQSSGNGFGAGGGGSALGSGSANIAGGAGSAGLCVIWEYA